MFKLITKLVTFMVTTVTTEGCAHAQNARILFMHMRINPDLGTFAPLVYAHAHKGKNIRFFGFFGHMSAQKIL
jgi:hypothetical protein